MEIKIQTYGKIREKPPGNLSSYTSRTAGHTGNVCKPETRVASSKQVKRANRLNKLNLKFNIVDKLKILKLGGVQ